jgi:hypothetical protein
MLITITWLLSSLVSAFAEPRTMIRVPAEVFAIGALQVGTATLSDVQSQLGSSNSYEHDEGLVRTLCYYTPINQGVVVLEFNAGALGGLKRLTGFVIRLAREHPEWCSPSLINLRKISIGKGVRLGESEREFRASLPVHFKRNNTTLSHEIEYRREMTEVEIASMKKQWPNIGIPSFFDVVEFVRAKFKSGVLEYYEVKRMESY